MARYYQTAERHFEDDVIFQPNIELAMTALAKKDQEMKDNLSKLDLLSSLPVDYIKGYDDAAVEEERARVQESVNQAVQTIKGDMLNSPLATATINRLRRDVENNYTTGNISKIQQSAQNYRKLNESLDKLTPEARSLYKPSIQGTLDSSGGKGSLSKVFENFDVMENRNISEDFFKSGEFKALGADSEDKQITTKNGLYFIKQGDKLVELKPEKVQAAFKNYTQNAGLDMYANDRTRFAGQKWLDAEGKLSYEPGTVLGDTMLNVGKTASYKQVGTTRDIQANSVELELYKIKEAQRQAQQANYETVAKTNVNAANAYTNRAEVREFERSAKNSYSDQIFRAANRLSATDPIPDSLKSNYTRYMQRHQDLSLKKLSTYYKGQGKFKTLTDKMDKTVAEIESRLVGSYAPLVNVGMDASSVLALEKDINSKFNTRANTFSYTLPESYQKTSDGKTKLVKSTKNYSTFRPQELVNKTFPDNDGVNRKVLKVDVIKDSPVPVFLNGFSENSKTSMNDNFATATMRIYFEPRGAGKVNKVTGSSSDKSLKREDMDYKDVEVNFSMRQLGLNNNY